MADGGFMAVYTFQTMIVLADKEGYVTLSPIMLGKRMGLPDPVNKDMFTKNLWNTFYESIKLLESPDPESNIPDCDGRRIIPLKEISEKKENRGWYIVNYIYYKEKKSPSDRAEYMRRYMRDYRQEDVNTSKQCKHHVNTEKVNSVNTEKPPAPISSILNNNNTTSNKQQTTKQTKSQTAKAKKEKEKLLWLEGFNNFWKLYPKRWKRKTALEEWNKIKPRPPIDEILDAVTRHKQRKDWKKQDGQFIPMPWKWIQDRRWEDEIPDSELVTIRCNHCGQSGVERWKKCPKCKQQVGSPKQTDLDKMYED